MRQLEQRLRKLLPIYLMHAIRLKKVRSHSSQFRIISLRSSLINWLQSHHRASLISIYLLNNNKWECLTISHHWLLLMILMQTKWSKLKIWRREVVLTNPIMSDKTIINKCNWMMKLPAHLQLKGSHLRVLMKESNHKSRGWWQLMVFHSLRW